MDGKVSEEFCLAVHDLWHWIAVLHRTSQQHKAVVDHEVKRAMERVKAADRELHRVLSELEEYEHAHR